MSFNQWKEVKLGELIQSVSVKHNFDKDKLIFLNTSDVLEGRVLHSNYTKVVGMPGQAKKSILKDDILFSEIRPKNKRFAYVDFEAEDYVVSTKLMVLRKKSDVIDNKFLYKYLTSDKMLNYLQIVAEGRSGTFPQITFSELKDIFVKLPSLQEQKSIAHILSTLDAKIEINNKINDNLEQMAQVIFKQWFVDFEFPNEDGKPYKSSGGEMVESEMGVIPRGWEVKVLGDIIELFDSKRIPLSKNEREKREKIHPYYGAASLMDFVDDYIFDGIYILMGEDGTVIDDYGFPILQYVWGRFWVNNHAHVIKGKGDISAEFIYIFLKNTNVSSIVTGAVQPKINQQNLKGLKIAMPRDNKLIVDYSNIVKSSFEEMRGNSDESNILTNMRDLLLPKLMSGEINLDKLEINI
ncbi:restriction endonuclease subunit S [Clostridium algidicarnis]|uniref:restriction endonuclease subunit S n=1 Tax=Clostridium algidicarnis TaxID=37659 RepID=UPI00162804A1|nr:restriction endonuclease subunit S [Clostridium algidicarnis]MBB6696671.1 restriction endonuclease subunit S [Clostridium algidicarnis]